MGLQAFKLLLQIFLLHIFTHGLKALSSKEKRQSTNFKEKWSLDMHMDTKKSRKKTNNQRGEKRKKHLDTRG